MFSSTLPFIRPFPTLSFEDLDWRTLCQVPRGKKYTGKLAYTPKEKREEKEGEESIVVDVPHVIVSPDTPRSEIFDCWAETLEWTDHLHPAFVKEKIEYACYEKARIFKETIEERGGIVLRELTRKVRVSSSSFSWNYNPEKETDKGEFGEEEGEKRGKRGKYSARIRGIDIPIVYPIEEKGKKLA